MFKRTAAILLSILIVAGSLDIPVCAAEVTSEISVEADFADAEYVTEEIVTEADDYTASTVSYGNAADRITADMAYDVTEEEVLSSDLTETDESGIDEVTVEVESEDVIAFDDDWDFIEDFDFIEEEEEAEDEYELEDDYVDNGSWRYIYVMPELTGDKRKDAAAIAYSQIGYHEGRNNKNAYGAQAAWCVYFARWCARRAGLTSGEWGDTGNTIVLSDWFDDRGRFHDKVSYEWSRNGFSGGGQIDPYIPQPGDFVAIESHGNKDNGPDHTGIVYSVKGDQMITVEGNLNNQVGLVVYSLRAGHSIKKYINGKWHFVSSEYIVGFGEPDYGDPEVTEEVETKSRESVSRKKNRSSGNAAYSDDEESQEQPDGEPVYEADESADDRSAQKRAKASGPVNLRRAVITGIPEDGIENDNGEVALEELIRSGEVKVVAEDGTVLRPYDAVSGEGDYEFYYKIKSRGRKISVVFLGTGRCSGSLRKTFRLAK